MPMKMYTFTEEELVGMIEKTVLMVLEKLGKVPEPWPWVGTKGALELLGVTSKTTLQDLRNKQAITYTQPMPKVILYDRNSIKDYLEKHSKKAL